MANRKKKSQAETVTMKSIAEEAGVTLTTVSRILNNKGDKYADATKKNILEIAERLKYRPNALVLGMQTGRTNTAGVMMPSSSTFYSQVISGIHDVFMKKETIMLLSWNDRSVTQQEEVIERQIIHRMVDRRVEGIILRPSSEKFERSYFEEIWERNIPLILIDRDVPTISTHFVGTDGYRGGEQVAEYLISLGHQNMLFAGSGSIVSSSIKREAGFRKVLSESLNAYCQRTLDSTQNSYQTDLLECMNQRSHPTAIFCYNDDLAMGTAKILLDAGFSIPGDVSIVGFGNLPYTDPVMPLTTVEQYPEKIGAEAARLYFSSIRDQTPEIKRRLLPTDLVVRGSTRSII